MNDRPAGAAAPSSEEDTLLGLIDRLAALIDETGLSELEIEAGDTVVAVRSASAIIVAPDAPSAPALPGAGAAAAGPGGAATTSIKAPLTGIWYGAPTPGSAPYVTVDAEIGAGQVVGLIEAMKLFNEIKSDTGGRVTRVLVESGQLVKARQPLIEVEPL